MHDVNKRRKTLQFRLGLAYIRIKNPLMNPGIGGLAANELNRAP